MQVKTIVRCHFIPLRMARIKMQNTTILSVSVDMKKLEPSYIGSGNIKWYS